MSSLVIPLRRATQCLVRRASTAAVSEKSQQVFDKENKYGAHNYHPLPVALAKGKGRL